MVTDHNGNTFETVTAMCEYWHISNARYTARISSGWSVEKALTTPVHKCVCDKIIYKGKMYSGYKELGNAFGLSDTTLKKRIGKGMSLEEALAAKNRRSISRRTDMYGKVYPTREAMGKAYGVSKTTMKRREKAGWSLEEILLGKEESVPFGVDAIETVLINLGVPYKKEVLLAVFHGCTPELRARKLRFDFVVLAAEEQVLIIEHDGQQHFKQNHFGNTEEEFATIIANDTEKNNYCRKTNTPMLRIRWDQFQDIETLVTNAVRRVETGNCEYWMNEMTEKAYYSVRQKPHRRIHKVDRTVKDHHGKLFAGYKEMAGAYGIEYKTLLYRLRSNWSLEDALTINVDKTNKQCGAKVTDHLGNEYHSAKDMAEAYGISIRAYTRRIHDGWSLEDTLTRPMKSTETSKAKPVLCVETGEVFPSCKRASKEKGILQANISTVLHEKGRTAGGYTWRYA